MAPQEIIDWGRTAGFWITGTRTRRETEGLLNEPHLDWYLTRLADDKAIDVDKLKRDKLQAHSSVDEDDIDSWPLYRALVAQLPSGNHAHLLVNGTWFQVATTLITEIDQHVDGLPSSTVHFPTAASNEYEKGYNRRAAAGSADTYLLDRDLLPAPGPRGSIECCDLLHRNGVFIHVKRYRSGSAELSHLFAQALVATTTFQDDPSFRAALRTKLEELGTAHAAAKRLAPEAQPNAADFEVAYAVIVPPRITRPSQLPFFAKLTLMRTSRLIQRLGYRVTVTLIATTGTAATGSDTAS